MEKLEKYQIVYIKFHGSTDTMEIIKKTQNRILARIKRPLCLGDVVEIDDTYESYYAEVIEQNGCYTVLWEMSGNYNK